MNRASITASVDDESAGGRTVDVLNPRTSAHGAKREVCCFHCGERCARGAVFENGRSFCCLGCQTVFALLTDSGLGQFYELASAPGARVTEKEMAVQEKWSFLDDPMVQEKLIDFADELQARVTLHLPAIHCIACVWLLEHLFRLRAGIGESRVNFSRREVSVTFERARVKLSEIAALLAALGYEPELTYAELDRGESGRTPRWRQRQWLQLVVGDRLILRHDELVPADARLAAGEARVDYSFVTGEAEPVMRRVGEHLYAGGRQTGGAIEVEMVKPVSESYLTSLWNNEAFRKSRDDERDSLTNRYSRRFTLAVVVVALAAAVFWVLVDASVAMRVFTSVLIVACPCALALAAPLTLGSAQRRLAGSGVFLRNASVVVRMAEVSTIVLDKTGTLTTGVAGGVTWHGPPLAETEERWLGSMTRHSAHPLAVRIGGSMGNVTRGEWVNTFRETPGCGMEGSVAGQEIWMGSLEWLSSRGVRSAAFGPLHPPNNPAPSTTSSASEWSAWKRPEGRAPAPDGSTVHVAIGGRYRGGFVLESALRPEVESLLDRLRGDCELVLLSGDNAREADRFRALLGEAARVEFNQSPFDKLNVIRELQAAGRRVMMVGDGGVVCGRRDAVDGTTQLQNSPWPKGGDSHRPDRKRGPPHVGCHQEGHSMSVLVLLIFASLAVATVFLLAFVWAVRSGQYEDTCTPSMRLLLDEPPVSRSTSPLPTPHDTENP